MELLPLLLSPLNGFHHLHTQGKSDGTINACLDPHNLNKAIIHEHYKALTLEEISHKLSGTTVFSKLDAKDGFWSIHLDTPSYLTTFNTHKGCYWYLHMPFGLKMSQDVFQMHMDQIINRLPCIIAIHNDICVFGKTRETTTEDTMSKTCQNSIQLKQSSF